MLKWALAFLLMLSIPASAEKASYLLEEQISQGFAELPADYSFKVVISSGVSPDAEAIMVPDFYMNKETGQFVANVALESGDLTRVTGMFVMRVPVPVPTRKLMPDEIVQPNDIQMVEIPYQRVSSFAIMDDEDVVGMQVRRVLTPGRPIMTQSVSPPIVIDRGQKVTIIYSKGAMDLTAPGKAMNDAYAGQEVRVINLVSNIAVVGQAVDEATVEISE